MYLPSLMVLVVGSNIYLHLNYGTSNTHFSFFHSLQFCILIKNVYYMTVRCRQNGMQTP